MIDKQTVLVCGGAGYIGSHVVRCLLEKGRQVLVLDNLSTGHSLAVPKDVLLIKGSIGQADLLEKVFAEHRVKAVVHLCARSLVGESVGDPLGYYENNICQGWVLLRSMVDCGVQKMVFSSTAAVYGNPQVIPLTEDHPTQPLNPYGFSKLAFERMLVDCGSAYGLRWVALRYFNAAGSMPDGSIGEDHRPESHLIPLVLKAALKIKHPELAESFPDDLRVFGSDYPTPDGTCIRDYIHVCDLAEAHLLALDYLDSGRESAVMNLGNGRGFSVKQVIQACREITGMPIECELSPRRPGDPAVLVSDSVRATRELGWQPRYNKLSEIISSAWDFHRRFPRGFPEG